MSNNMKISVSIILVIIAITIMACAPDKTSETEAVVIRDITDTYLSQPKPEDITKLFGLDNSQWNGANFRFVEISNVSYNPTFEASIIAENKWMGNEFERQKKVKVFYENISKILNKADKETVGKDNSSIYATVAKELNKLSQSKAENRILLIYSDLMENTTDLSFYKNNILHLLKEKPDLILKYFEAEVPLQRLDGIKIYMVYQPANTEQDNWYKVSSGFYMKLFESKGAIVEISANVN
jgi:hypothetical protein